VRDGRDATISLKRYLKNTTGTIYSYPQLIAGMPLGYTWSEHIESYKRVKGHNVVWITFDELTMKPRDCIEHVGKLIKQGHGHFDVPSWEELHSVNSVSFPSGRSGDWKNEFDEQTARYFVWKNASQLASYCEHSTTGPIVPANDGEMRLLDIELMQGKLNQHINELLKQTNNNMEEIRKIMSSMPC
jgi:hypothetical protein